MSVGQKIYLGPFVEHQIEDDHFTDNFARTLYGIFDYNVGVSLPPSITLNNKKVFRYCFFPCVFQPGGPMRKPRIDNSREDVISIQNLDISSEVDWFVKAYRYELAKLDNEFAREGRVDWGLVHWVA